jgi:hypothetical protein
MEDRIPTVLHAFSKRVTVMWPSCVADARRDEVTCGVLAERIGCAFPRVFRANVGIKTAA